MSVRVHVHVCVNVYVCMSVAGGGAVWTRLCGAMATAP